MKTNRSLSALALAIGLLFGAAQMCPAQNYNNQPQRFGLATELATYLQLTTSQIDNINRNLLVVNYDWNEAVQNTLVLDQQLVVVQNDDKQSPSAIGLTAGDYIRQKVVIARAIINEVVASNKVLLAMLTAQQRQKLETVQIAVNAQNNSNIYSINSEAFNGNLFLGQYSVTGFDPNGGPNNYPLPSISTTSLAQAFSDSVAEAATEQTKERAVRARRARMIPMTGR